MIHKCTINGDGDYQAALMRLKPTVDITCNFLKMMSYCSYSSEERWCNYTGIKKQQFGLWSSLVWGGAGADQLIAI